MQESSNPTPLVMQVVVFDDDPFIVTAQPDIQFFKVIPNEYNNHGAIFFEREQGSLRFRHSDFTLQAVPSPPASPLETYSSKWLISSINFTSSQYSNLQEFLKSALLHSLPNPPITDPAVQQQYEAISKAFNGFSGIEARDFSPSPTASITKSGSPYGPTESQLRWSQIIAILKQHYHTEFSLSCNDSTKTVDVYRRVKNENMMIGRFELDSAKKVERFEWLPPTDADTQKVSLDKYLAATKDLLLPVSAGETLKISIDLTLNKEQKRQVIEEFSELHPGTRFYWIDPHNGNREKKIDELTLAAFRNSKPSALSPGGSGLPPSNRSSSAPQSTSPEPLATTTPSGKDTLSITPQPNTPSSTQSLNEEFLSITPRKP